MRVRALAVNDQKYAGYYGLVRRKPGDVFDLADPKHFSKTWMEQVPDGTEKSNAPGEATPEELGYVKPPPEPRTLSEAGKRGTGKPVLTT